MENSQPPSESEEEMSFEQKISQAFGTDRPSRSRHQTFGQGLFAEGGGSAFPHQRLVILSLGLLNGVLLIAAAVLGIYCAKAKDFEVPHSSATSLIIERNYLRNHTDITRAKLETQAALARERTNHVHLKLQVKQQKALIDSLQRKIETLQTERTTFQSTKTGLEESCGRCHPGWSLLKSSCYYFSGPQSAAPRNWPDSRADCIRQGGDLLVISSLEEQQLMSDNFPTSTSSSTWWHNGVWIGLTGNVTEGTWVWINNVTEMSTMYWRSGQPSQSGPQSGNCAAFFHYVDTMKAWYNANCLTELLAWVCEMEPRET